jgi:hypothetical protein
MTLRTVTASLIAPERPPRADDPDWRSPSGFRLEKQARRDL